MVDMSAEGITSRLRAPSRLSHEQPAPPPVDMSPAAVGRRLREWSELSALCLELIRVGRAQRGRLAAEDDVG